jgi:hypothetical protein
MTYLKILEQNRIVLVVWRILDGFARPGGDALTRTVGTWYNDTSTSTQSLLFRENEHSGCHIPASLWSNTAFEYNLERIYPMEQAGSVSVGSGTRLSPSGKPTTLHCLHGNKACFSINPTIVIGPAHGGSRRVRASS